MKEIEEDIELRTTLFRYETESISAGIGGR